MTEPRIPRNAEELFDPDAARPDPTEGITGGRVRTTDAEALKHKALSDTATDITEENDIREVLQLPSGAGVRLISRLIEACGWNTPYFHPSNSIMSEVAGRRSLAWQLEGWISDADIELWVSVRRHLELKRQKPKAAASSASDSKRTPART